MPFLEAENHKDLNLCAVSHKKTGDEREMERDEEIDRDNGKKE